MSVSTQLESRMESYQRFDFRDGRFAFPVYRKGPAAPGAVSPAIIVMHEVPGIYPAVIDFCERLIGEGFTVYMPSLLGTPGKAFSAAYTLQSITRACISKEFSVLSSGRSSPVADALRALCRLAHKECGGVGVGAIGMCLTGNFALSLMVDASVMAPVLSQPSLPFGFTATQRAALHVSDAELARIRQRVQQEGVGVLGLRFTGDPLCPRARFDRLREELGDGFEAIEINSAAGNPHGIPASAHSVVTRDLVDEDGHPTREALQRVLAFYRERLLPA